MELTKKQRLELYKNMLKGMNKRKNYHFGLCELVYSVQDFQIIADCENQILVHKKARISELPEIWNRKPKKMYSKSLWFNPSSWYGQYKRKQIIKQAIRELEGRMSATEIILTIVLIIGAFACFPILMLYMYHKSKKK